jgi:hypothetical protein
MSKLAVVLLLASQWTSIAMAQSTQFAIEILERAEVPFPDKPGKGLMVLARFHWQDSSQTLVASVPGTSCERSPDKRVGFIGRPASSSGILTSSADKTYEWQWDGAKPTDKLFTAICSQE